MVLLQRLSAFFQTLRYCYRNARAGFRSCVQREGIPAALLLVSYLWNTGLGLLKIFVFQLTTRYAPPAPAPREVLVVVTMPGYLMSTKGMAALNAALRARGHHLITTRGVLTLRSRKRIREQALAACRAHRGRPVLLLGYSFGGSIAHALGAELGLPSLSLSTPLDSKGAPFGAIMALFGIENYRDPVIPASGMNLVESFSETIPHPVPDGEQRTWKIPGVHSHFAVNDPRVIAALVDAVARYQNAPAPAAAELQLVEHAA